MAIANLTRRTLSLHRLWGHSLSNVSRFSLPNRPTVTGVEPTIFVVHISGLPSRCPSNENSTGGGHLAHLTRVVAVARVNIHLRHIRFDTNPVPFSGCSRIGRMISDHILVSEGLTGFRHGFFRLNVVARMEGKAPGLLRQ